MTDDEFKALEERLSLLEWIEEDFCGDCDYAQTCHHEPGFAECSREIKYEELLDEIDELQRRLAEAEKEEE